MKLSIYPVLVVLIIFSSASIASAQMYGGGEANPDLHTNQEALKAFQDKRFGMFIHWGPVTLRGEEISWSRGVQIPKEDYDNLYKEFNPVLFNAQDWVKAAKDAGMKYIVLTARHHDGFCLWDSEYTDYDMASTPYGKGVVKELAEACKKQGIEFGVYYTICDWWHEDYPVVYPDPNYKFHLERDITDPVVKAKMDLYIQYMKNQLKELIDNYDPTLIWFDGEWEWAWTHEMGMDMYAYLRGLKDDLLINNRVDKGREGMAGTTKSHIFAGDYATPEQQVGDFDNKNAWETCMTIGKQWAWKPNDKLKSKRACIQALINTVGGDGNLLFNVGPMPDGRIEQRQIDRLKEMGDWLKINGESIYGTRGGPFKPSKHVVSTRKENKIYLHLLDYSKTNLKLLFPSKVKIRRAYFLNGNTSLAVVRDKDNIDINLPQKLPDDIATVIVLELNKSAFAVDIIE
ncbi:alpha-L-fucosidase [Fulvivirgaceae bacterium BMA10]|uniref:alpha-L-fucosidase n=1 Tax=Splendidivirga corallicola TaxID=3051826 RepID=A0ABT8KPK1_9BACT|nr:alpha-L-fucosidase [Fulvivirgaceae bacterium BMA10]